MWVRLRNTLAGAAARVVHVYRRNRDRGDESVSKVLWAGAIVAIVAAVTVSFRDTLVGAFNSLVITLGFG